MKQMETPPGWMPERKVWRIEATPPAVRSRRLFRLGYRKDTRNGSMPFTAWFDDEEAFQQAITNIVREEATAAWEVTIWAAHSLDLDDDRPEWVPVVVDAEVRFG